MRYLFLISALFIFQISFAQNNDREVKAEEGDGIHTLLERYGLDSAHYVKSFKEINKEKLGENNWLYAGQTYTLPADPKTESDNTQTETQPSNQNQGPTTAGVYEIFGDSYKKVEKVDNKLNQAVFYIVAGHGGPDPGAIGKREGNTMCEDEYAYDVALRLCRNLITHGAKAYMIIKDSTDGIRDEAYLKCDKDEYCRDGSSIPLNQLKRLKQRTDMVNKLYKENRSAAYQRVIVLHVDSRSTGTKLDVFFYHHEKSTKGKTLANLLQETFEKKYSQHQPARGYQGTVTSRGLYLINNTTPPCVYIELGNIQNSRDQIRFIKADNRQALANWLTLGLIKDFEKSKTN